VRQAIALGEVAHLETASAECTDAVRLGALERGRLQTWAEAFPAPRREPARGLAGSVPAQMAAPFAGVDSRRQAGAGRRSARVVGALGDRGEVSDPAQGLSWRGTSDDQRFRGAVVRQRLVQMAQHAALSQATRLLPPRRLGWRAQDGSAPRAGPSSRPSRKRTPRRARRRARRR